MHKKRLTTNKALGLFFQIGLCLLLIFAAVIIRNAKKSEAVTAGVFGEKLHQTASFTLSDLAKDTENTMNENGFWTAFFRIDE